MKSHGCCRKRTEKEARKHMQRRKKRKRDKAADGEAAANGVIAVDAAENGGDGLLASDLLAPLQVCGG